MDKIKRNERIGAMARILTAAPNHIFTLGRFCGMFEAAKIHRQRGRGAAAQGLCAV